MITTDPSVFMYCISPHMFDAENMSKLFEIMVKSPSKPGSAQSLGPTTASTKLVSSSTDTKRFSSCQEMISMAVPRGGPGVCKEYADNYCA